ncbi:hypothetical protein BD408DRAFT_481965 [Parasitella parasitica]|nr:hypothetical protein BD408DRAFT_481965 [Parasitella parasitica]
MKFSLVSAFFIGLAALVVAEDEPRYFLAPGADAEFPTNGQISFTAVGITNDADETIIAKLFNAADDSEVKQIGSYSGEPIVRPDDENPWSFTWVIDVQPGTYYVRLYEQDADGQIDDDDEWDNEIISYDFRVVSPPSKRKRSLRRSQRAQALKMAGL